MFGKNKNTDSPSVSNLGNSLSHNFLIAGTIINGDLEIATDIRIDGVLNGNLNSTAKVVLGSQSKIEGNINCKQVLIEGTVNGNIIAKERIHLLNSAVIKGDMTTDKLIIENGAQFNGAAVMQK